LLQCWKVEVVGGGISFVDNFGRTRGCDWVGSAMFPLSGQSEDGMMSSRIVDGQGHGVERLKLAAHLRMQTA
jgi:hypothetical protein